MNLRQRLTTRLPKRFIRGTSAAHRWVFVRFGGRGTTHAGGRKFLLLTTTGRRTGLPRTWPLLYLDDLALDGRVLVAASNGGHDRDPGWCHNLRAEPNAIVDLGGAVHTVRARFLAGAERAAAFARFVDAYGGYADYAAVTGREIPIVALEPRTGG